MGLPIGAAKPQLSQGFQRTWITLYHSEHCYLLPVGSLAIQSFQGIEADRITSLAQVLLDLFFCQLGEVLAIDMQYDYTCQLRNFALNRMTNAELLATAKAFAEAPMDQLREVELRIYRKHFPELTEEQIQESLSE
jgi:hypothetical protein